MKAALARLRSLALLALLALPPAFAAEPADDGPELLSRVPRYSASYTINEDGSFTETREMAVKVLKEQAVKGAKQHSISYSTSVQKAEVLAAYTQKPDGRRIDAPKSNFQVEANTGNGQDAPVFSDMTTLTVVFPDVEVGDTLAFSYRLTASEPLFPKHFSAQESFPRTVAYDDVRIRIDAPASLWTQHQARELREVVNAEKDGRRVIEWAYANPRPVKSKRYDYSVYDVETEPGFEFSTFRSHAEIAAAYGARARPKAAPTERIRKLADDIAKDAKTPRETARALYDWVALNITYAGNCIGLGAVVPHDTDFILDNRMGDCKDHATLLEALLAARGIASSQALVNAGAAYRLPRVPLASMVNHVINYLPAFDLYADSTSNSTPFGLLPYEDSDKPVLRVDGHQEGTRTPILAVGRNRQAMKTTVTILPDGSARGEVQVSLEGMFAAGTRARLRRMKKETEDDLVKNMYKNMGYIGSGTLEKEDPSALADSYRYGAKFEVSRLFQYPGAGAFAIWPFFFSDAPISGYITGAMQQDDEPAESACASGRSVEEYTYILPREMKVLAIPDDMKLANSFVSYEATYKRKGNVLTVRRVLDDRTPGHVCSRRMVEEYRSFAKAVLPNLKAQVLYK